MVNLNKMGWKCNGIDERDLIVLLIRKVSIEGRKQERRTGLAWKSS